MNVKEGWLLNFSQNGDIFILRHHKKAIRQVTYHERYPLFASCSDDGTVIICHGMVYRFVFGICLLSSVGSS